MAINWRTAARAAEADAPNVVKLGRPTLENRIDNVRSAQQRLIKACAEVKAARSDLEASQRALADELNGLDCGISVQIEAIPDEMLTEATR